MYNSVSAIMKKINWFDWIKYKPDIKERYPFWFVNSKNEVQAYEGSEEKKYKQALTRHKNGKNMV